MEEEDFPYFSLEFNFPSIQETAEKPNEQQQQARRFPSLQEEALSLVILTTSFFRDKRRKPSRRGFQLIECSPNFPRVYIRLCKHGNHFTFLHLNMVTTFLP